MSRKFRIAYLSHSLRSDWNNGNAHFLRGLLSALGQLGHEVLAFEAADEWSIHNLRQERDGQHSLEQFASVYPDVNLRLYPGVETTDEEYWRNVLQGVDVVVVHEWNPPALAHTLLGLRDQMGFRLLFHDTHHRASSSPEAIRSFGTDRFDGVLVFGEALRAIYLERFGMERVWTVHEAADTRVFKPATLPGAGGAQETISAAGDEKKKSSLKQDVVWVGNWGDDERSAEIREYLLEPAAKLPQYKFTIYGVRYPKEGLQALAAAGVRYGGYLPNLQAPGEYAASRLTVHVPRQQYNGAMTGIPTIRVFEALACGVPLISAPWQDTEGLFREGDFRFVQNGEEMRRSMQELLEHPKMAAEQAARGLETVLARHTCRHRAEQVSSILEELCR